MSTRGFSLPVMSAAMLLAFAAPSFANNVLDAQIGITCSGATITADFDFIGNDFPPYHLLYSFQLQPSGGGTPLTVSGSFGPLDTTMTHQVFSVTGSPFPLTSGLTYTVITGTASAQLQTSAGIANTITFGTGITFNNTTVGPCSTPPPPPTSCTVTQGGWGAAPHGGNAPATFLVPHFPVGGVSIGGPLDTSLVIPFGLKFDSQVAVQNFLPQGGPPGPLNASGLDPLSTSAGVFAGQVLALKLNTIYGSVGSLILHGTGTSLDGKSVNFILAAANTALAGGALPAGFTYSSLNDLIDNLNQAFDGCVTDGWAAAHLTTVAPV